MVESELSSGETVHFKKQHDLRQRIVDATIELAEEVGWDGIRLRDVAARLGISLSELQSQYRDLDAIADAWFAQALQAMLAPAPDDFAAMPAIDRLYIMIMRWFDALAPHHKVTCDMLKGKLYPSHPHHWVPMIFNLSRTIHWLRDAALLDAVGRRRQVEEIGLTALFLATLSVWQGDQTPGQERTRKYLRRRLENADRAMVRLWGKYPTPAEASDTVDAGGTGTAAQ